MRSNGPVCRRACRIHDVEADALLARDLKIAPALLDHGRCEVGEEECAIRIAREQMPAEQSGAAAKLEHAGRCELRQQAAQAAPPRRAANLHARHRCPHVRRSSGRRRRYGWRACAKSRTWPAHHSGCFRGSTWPPVSDQRIVSLPQMASLMACRHYGVVAGGKGESWAGKLGLRLGLIPVQQPAKSLVEPLHIESLRRCEGLGAAAAPEGLKGLAWIAAKPAPHAGDPRGRDVGTEAVEALDADEAAERRPALLPCPVKQPEQPRVSGRQRWRRSARWQQP